MFRRRTGALPIREGKGRGLDTHPAKRRLAIHTAGLLLYTGTQSEFPKQKNGWIQERRELRGSIQTAVMGDFGDRPLKKERRRRAVSHGFRQVA